MQGRMDAWRHKQSQEHAESSILCWTREKGSVTAYWALGAEQAARNPVWKSIHGCENSHEKAFLYKTARPLVTRCTGSCLLTMVFREFLILVKEGGVRSCTNQTSITISTKNSPYLSQGSHRVPTQQKTWKRKIECLLKRGAKTSSGNIIKPKAQFDLKDGVL